MSRDLDIDATEAPEVPLNDIWPQDLGVGLDKWAANLKETDAPPQLLGNECDPIKVECEPVTRMLSVLAEMQQKLQDFLRSQQELQSEMLSLLGNGHSGKSNGVVVSGVRVKANGTTGKSNGAKMACLEVNDALLLGREQSINRLSSTMTHHSTSPCRAKKQISPLLRRKTITQRCGKKSRSCLSLTSSAAEKLPKAASSVASNTSNGTMPSRPAIRQQVDKSRSAFDALRTVDEDKQELRMVFELAEAHEASQTQRRTFHEQAGSMTSRHIELTLDSVIGFVIAVNAVFIGISMDAPDDSAGTIFVIDMCFSVAFITELIIKLCVNGFKSQFCGPLRVMNTFDASLILCDLLSVVIHILQNGTNKGDLHYASLFRVVRLCRLVRVLRLLRHPSLQTLMIMMHGMVGGMPTLCWSLVLFVFSVYMVALLCREFLGQDDGRHERSYRHFNSVPRAMITTFRCSFGDCNDISGAPIFEQVEEEYGIGCSLLYCLFAFSMAIGMFNVISAIFVQSTMSAATAIKHKQKKERLQDDVLWATRVNTVVRRVGGVLFDWEPSTQLSERIDSIYDLDISRAVMDEIGLDPAVQAALEDLDVDPEDHEILADIIDVDQNGFVVVIELLQAIRRLRGDPRRSDIVRVDLLCQSILTTLREMQGMFELYIDLPARQVAAPQAQ
eukprot:TRINITY_DN28442_c0_g2_i1.p1 TRINITY_DN28442_c0_g2~~TRINITY_DN28442_c0_g2_i1.p1  ORF type:complete len:673 (-),score=77.94 TRINITY_DN28442_c0_g2_i1:79-2097(-)